MREGLSADDDVEPGFLIRIIEPRSELDILVEPAHVIVPTFG